MLIYITINAGEFLRYIMYMFKILISFSFERPTKCIPQYSLKSMKLRSILHQEDNTFLPALTMCPQSKLYFTTK